MDKDLSAALEKAAAAERKLEEQRRSHARPTRAWYADLADERRAAVTRNWRAMLQWITDGKASREGALEAFLSVYGTTEYATLTEGTRHHTLMILQVEMARAVLASSAAHPVAAPLLEAYRVWARGVADTEAREQAAQAAARIQQLEPALKVAEATAQRARQAAETATHELQAARAAHAEELARFRKDVSWLKRQLTAEGRDQHGALTQRLAAVETALALEASEARSVAELADGELLFTRDELRTARATLETLQGRARKSEAELLTPLGLELTGDEACALVTVPAGRFWMGSAEFGDKTRREEIPLRRVELSAPFRIGVFPVTQALYLAVMGDNPSRPAHPLYPVNRVSWYDACRFCNALSSRSGLERAYTIDDAQQRVVWRRRVDGYRLPTEAEWECAARGDASFEYAGSDDLRQVGWFMGNSPSTLKAVGQRRPNGYGLFDCSGNVWEWCHCGYAADQYRRSPTINPRGPEDAPTRVIRGGSCNNVEERCRIAARGDARPDGSDVFLGFRIVRGPAEPVTDKG